MATLRHRLRPLGARFGRLRHCAAGSMAVEFAIVGPVFLLMLLGVFEFGRLYWVRNTIQYAAEEAGRFAMMNPTATTTQIVNATLSHMSHMDGSDLTVNVTTDVTGGITHVTIAAAYTFDFLLPLPVDSPTLTGQARVPLPN